MSTIRLQPSQRTVLRSLVNLAGRERGAVRGAVIAAEVDRTPGTVRNQMQNLKALRLVEGIPGLKGGYRPTAEAFETLDVQRIDDPADVPVARDGDAVPDVSVERIDFSTVHDPSACRAEVVLRGPVSPFEEGDRVTVGPTPATALRLDGAVESVLAAEHTLVVCVRDLQTDSTAAPEDA